jgi:hypothetical protein
MTSDKQTMSDAVPGKSFFGSLMKLISVILSIVSIVLGVMSKSLPVFGGTVAATILSLFLSKNKK